MDIQNNINFVNSLLSDGRAKLNNGSIRLIVEEKEVGSPMLRAVNDVNSFVSKGICVIENERVRTITVAEYRNRPSNIQILDITPVLAQEMLDNNDGNRKLNPSAINKYKQDMLEGKFPATHQAFAQDWNGRLIDGQNRLTAGGEADFTFKSAILVKDMPPDMSYYIDNGKNRTPAHHIEIAGVNRLTVEGEEIQFKSSDISSTARCMLGGIGGPHQKSTPKGRDLVIKTEKYKEGIYFAINAFSKKKRLISSAPVKGAIARAFMANTNNRPFIKRLKEFCAVLTTKQMKSPNDQMAVSLLDFVENNPGVRNGSSVCELYGKTVRAIELFCNNEVRTKLLAPERDIWELPE